MADISTDFLGIKSPNPFWLASAPPTDKLINVVRAFEAGWGGVVWKTLGSQVKNVSSRYSSVNYGGKRMMGFNNIELISDRPLEINLKEILEVVKMFPDRAMIVSLMADNDRKSWHELIMKCEDAGAMGFELNFGCPHGMTERGMGAAVGQDPAIAKMVVEWVMEKATIPVITKLTPNVHSVVPTARGAVEGGTSALSLINTIQSVTGVDLDTLVPNPYVAGKSVFEILENADSSFWSRKVQLGFQPKSSGNSMNYRLSMKSAKQKVFCSDSMRYNLMIDDATILMTILGSKITTLES